MQDDYKGGFFGGIPSDELATIVTFWTSIKRPGTPATFNDQQWIAELVKKVEVLGALVTEENAAANAGEFDVVSVVMKAMDVRQRHLDAVNSGSNTNLVTAIKVLQKAWSA
jgi:hypothetical protein